MLGPGALMCVGAGAHEFWMLPQAFRLPAGGAATLASIRANLPRAGTHVIALDTNPSMIELAAETFNAYLRQEGLVVTLAPGRDGTSMASVVHMVPATGCACDWDS